MDDVAVLTAIYDGYDTVKPVCPQTYQAFGYESGFRVRWILVTDDPGKLVEAEPGALSGWEVITQPRPHLHPNHAAKYPKFMPELYTGAPLTVWIDASYRVVSPHFVSEARSYADPIAQFVHPWRDCAMEEAAFSRTLAKYDGQPLAGQATHYRALGLPPHWGLWATGVIIRDHHAPASRQLGDFGSHWLSEVEAWTWQDQVSEPYILKRFGLRPTALPGDHITNPWLKYEGSARHG
jgi:hypothetical protein